MRRRLSGFVGAHLGWREMFWIGVPLALSAAPLMRLMLQQRAVRVVHVFWTILSQRLVEPRFGIGSDVAGHLRHHRCRRNVRGPMAGRIADRRGPHLVASLSAIGTLISWIVFGM